MIILLDFDGTCVKHEFPKVGKDIGAVPVLKKLIDNGHQLILFTMRSNHISEPVSVDKDIHIEKGNYLDDAVNWFKINNIPLYGIQENPTQKGWTSSPKPYGHMIIDDISLGIPLKYEYNKKNNTWVKYVDWGKVTTLLANEGLI